MQGDLPPFPLVVDAVNVSIVLPACDLMGSVMERQDQVIKAARALVEDLLHDYGPDQAGLHESLAVATFAAEMLKAMHAAGRLTVPPFHAPFRPTE